MKILLASPFYSQHWDAGHYWARAFSRLGHELVLWDYRTDASPPDGTRCDLAVVMKGNPYVGAVASAVAQQSVCYWPDSFERGPDDGDQPPANFPKPEELLKSYDIVFTPIRPTPEGLVWLPGAWDEKVHVRQDAIEFRDALFAGTRTDRKAEFLKSISPLHVFGNGWTNTDERDVVASIGSLGHHGPRYLHDYVATLSSYLIAINVHRDNIGVNRRLFEMMACGFTITDRVPGVVEILGEELAEKVTFETPEEGREMKDRYLGRHLAEVAVLWDLEKKAIANYTYIHLARSIIDQVNALS